VATLRIETLPVFEPLVAPARYKAAFGGRGAAKSHFFSELWLEENVSERLDVVCIREVQKSLTYSVKRLLEQKIERFNAGYYFDVQDKRIMTRRGGVTVFEGMQDQTSESMKSFEAFDRAWFEEAQSASQRSLDTLRPTIRKAGSELWFSWNPKKATDPIDKLLRAKEPPPGAVVVRTSYRDNPWLPEELKRELAYDQRHDPDKFAHIWLGEYQRNSEARVFKNWRIEEFEVDPAAIKRQGADWGYCVDPTVLAQCYLVGRKLYVPYEAYMVACEIDDTPALFMTVPEAEKWPITADSARPETISHMRRHGFPKIMAAVKGPKSVEEGVEFLRSLEIIVHPRCVHTIDELTLYSFETDPLTGVVLPKLRDKNNNVIDALRYACEGADGCERERRSAGRWARGSRAAADFARRDSRPVRARAHRPHCQALLDARRVEGAGEEMQGAPRSAG
jgi:phage terminase large subunit